jgi:hypothetical protein
VARRRDPTRPSLPTTKRLFAHSGNRCAFHGCTATLIDGSTVVGQVCHIKGARPGSARYDAKQSAADRHGFGNLILMCGPHHDVIDDKENEESYPVDLLLKMKADHESRTANIDDDFAERAAHLLINQPVTSVNQSGGITAGTVRADTINVYASDATHTLRGTERESISSSALQIEVGETGRFSNFSREGMNLYKLTRVLNIKVENIDKRWPVTSCKVYIIGIEPSEYSGPWILKEGFSLSAGEHLFIPLVSYGEAREPDKDPCGDSFMVIRVPEPSPKLSAHSCHVLTLRVTSLDTAPCELQCKLWVDQAGKLRIQKLPSC